MSADLQNAFRVVNESYMKHIDDERVATILYRIGNEVRALQPAGTNPIIKTATTLLMAMLQSSFVPRTAQGAAVEDATTMARALHDVKENKSVGLEPSPSLRREQAIIQTTLMPGQNFCTIGVDRGRMAAYAPGMGDYAIFNEGDELVVTASNMTEQSGTLTMWRRSAAETRLEVVEVNEVDEERRLDQSVVGLFADALNRKIAETEAADMVSGVVKANTLSTLRWVQGEMARCAVAAVGEPEPAEEPTKPAFKGVSEREGFLLEAAMQHGLDVDLDEGMVSGPVPALIRLLDVVAAERARVYAKELTDASQEFGERTKSRFSQQGTLVNALRALFDEREQAIRLIQQKRRELSLTRENGSAAADVVLYWALQTLGETP